jgi:excisionase family DNA binding protein
MQSGNHSEPSLLLSLKEAAATLAVSERTVWTLVQEGVLPHLRLGRRLLFSRMALEAWIAKTESQSAKLSGGLSLGATPV